MNVVVLSLCLAGILLFKNLVGDRAASLIDQVAGTGSGAGAGDANTSTDLSEGSGEGTASAALAPNPAHATARTVSTARALLHRALPATDAPPAP